MARLRPALAVLCLLLPVGALAGEPATPRRLCPEDAPEGVRLPPRPGCDAGTRAPPAKARASGHDLGGVTLRIGGRVGAEAGFGR